MWSIYCTLELLYLLSWTWEFLLQKMIWSSHQFLRKVVIFKPIKSRDSTGNSNIFSQTVPTLDEYPGEEDEGDADDLEVGIEIVMNSQPSFWQLLHIFTISEKKILNLFTIPTNINLKKDQSAIYKIITQLFYFNVFSNFERDHWCCTKEAQFLYLYVSKFSLQYKNWVSFVQHQLLLLLFKNFFQNLGIKSLSCDSIKIYGRYL